VEVRGSERDEAMSHTDDKPLSKQSARQLARRAALDAQAKMRAQRVEREKRLSARGVEVMVALAQRDELVRRCEQRAGEALHQMTAVEGAGPGPGTVERVDDRRPCRVRHARGGLRPVPG